MEHQVLPARVRGKILDAALTCIGRVGVAKTTLDDVARQAGCARATVYRYFPGKQPLLNAVVAREADRLTGSLLAAADAADDLPAAAAAVLTTGARFLLDHDALRFVLTVEPEVLLPHISFERGDALLAAAGERLAPAFTRDLDEERAAWLDEERAAWLDEERAARLGEWLARIGFSYLCSAAASDLVDDDRVRALIVDFVLPGLGRHVPSEGIPA